MNTLKSRTLTKRQAKRLEEMENVRAEVGLKNLENKLASISDNSGIQIIDVVLQETRNNLNTLTIYQLDVSQVERLKKAWANYKDLRLVEIEKLISSHEEDKQTLYTIEKTLQLVQELQRMNLSTEQNTRLEEANKKIEKIKKQKEENQRKQLLKTIQNEYVKLLDDNKADDSGWSCSDEGYFLYDIDCDGIPELWIKTGTCEANYRMLVYTYVNGSKMIYDASAGHSSFYIGDGYVLRVYGHMGYGEWEKLTYNGTSITANTIYEEELTYEDSDYREPEEKYIKLYSLTNKHPVLNAFK